MNELYVFSYIHQLNKIEENANRNVTDQLSKETQNARAVLYRIAGHNADNFSSKNQPRSLQHYRSVIIANTARFNINHDCTHGLGAAR